MPRYTGVDTIVTISCERKEMLSPCWLVAAVRLSVPGYPPLLHPMSWTRAGTERKKMPAPSAAEEVCSPSLRATSPARMDSSASNAGAPLGSGVQGLEDCQRRIDLFNAARKLRGLPVRDYQNDRKALARDVLRFEIALQGVKFLRSLEYAPPDAALTTSVAATNIGSASFAGTSIAATAVSTAALTLASTTATATGSRARTGRPHVESAGTIPARYRGPWQVVRVEKLNDVFPTTWKVTLAKPDATMGVPNDIWINDARQAAINQTVFLNPGEIVFLVSVLTDQLAVFSPSQAETKGRLT